MIADVTTQSAYSRLLPLYCKAAETCKSDEDVQALRNMLNEFHFRTLAKNHTSNDTALGQVMSLPEQETKKHYGSPERNQCFHHQDLSSMLIFTCVEFLHHLPCCCTQPYIECLCCSIILICV